MWARPGPSASDGIVSRQVLTVRAGMEVCRQVGQLCRPVASVADEYGVAWDTAWAAVVFHSRPLVDDPGRIGNVRALGVDQPRIRRRELLASTADRTPSMRRVAMQLEPSSIRPRVRSGTK